MTELTIPRVADVSWSDTGLVVADPNLPFERFEELVRAAGAFGDAARWILGDLLLFGEGRYGERYAQALELARVGENQLSNYRYVCERVARSRRRENLSFSHHREVAPLEPAAQGRLLDQASKEGWTRAMLREKVTDLRAVAPPPAKSAPPARQEVLPAPEAVDTARNLSTVRETLERLGGGLEDETARAVGIPAALRAVDEVGATVKRALEAPAPAAPAGLYEAAHRVIRQATRSSGFAMVPLGVFEELERVVLAH